MKTVIGFNGSPRPLGNTGRLVKAVLSGAEEAGAKARYVHLAALKFSDCTACMNCRQHPACVQPDDMSKIVQDIFHADAIVLGSPVYMWQVTGLAKLFMDRLYPVLGPDYTTRLTRKPKLVLAFTQGHPDAAYFRPYFEQTKAVLSFLGFTVTDIISAVGTRASDDIEKQTEVLAQALAAGGRLV